MPQPVDTEEQIQQARRRLNNRRREAAWEDGFLDRTLGMSVAVAAFVLTFLLSLGRSREASSYVIGAAISISLFAVMRYSVVNLLTRSDLGRKKKWITFGLTVSKYGLAGLLIYGFTRWPHAHLPAFVGGVATVQAVLFLKGLGRTLTGEKPPAHWRERPAAPRFEPDPLFEPEQRTDRRHLTRVPQ